MVLRFLLVMVLTPIAVFGAKEPAEETYALPKFEVKTQLVCSFGIGIVASWDAKNQAIGRIFISEVSSDSTAERIGLRRGDEILSINGKKVSELKGGNKPGSDLYALLVNRPPGEEINIEVSVRAVKKVTLPAAGMGVPGPLRPATQLPAAPAR
jgi:C-terminal processing protease CtpA/Prc